MTHSRRRNFVGVLLPIFISILLLSASISSAAKPAAKKLSDLPNTLYQDPGKENLDATYYTGYMDTEDNQDHVFYLLVESANGMDKAPLIIFLNGGPGCSSMVSFSMEVGPVRFDPQEKILKNAALHSWHQVASVLFIDNPVGAGYSFGKTKVTSAAQAMKMLDSLLVDQFLKDFPKAFDNGVYVVAESYGAKYAIELSLDDKKMSKHIRGIALGDGWVAPKIQESVYSRYGYALGLLNYRSALETNARKDKCLALVEEGWYDKAQETECLSELHLLLQSGGGFNSYDMREMGNYKFLDALKDFFSKDATMDALDVNQEFSLCSNSVWDNFLKDFQRSYLMDAVNLLDKDKKILVYNGQFDIRCSVEGTNEWLRVAPWKYRATWNSLQQGTFFVNNNTKGIFKEYKNLKQVVLYNAGHLAPYDQQEASLSMISRFIRDESLCAKGKTCSGAPVQCPNQCSEHGNCDTATNTCTCDKHYQGDDCSTYQHFLTFESKKVFSGLITGRDYHIYRLDIGEFGDNLFDAQILLKKLPLKNGLRMGKLHAYLYAGPDYLSPDPEKPIVKQFPHHSLVDAHETKLHVNELHRSNISKLTVIVQNIVDTEARYSIEVSTLVSGSKADGTLIAMISSVSLLGIIMMGLFVICTAQWLFFRRTLHNQKKNGYSTSAGASLLSGAAEY